MPAPRHNGARRVVYDKRRRDQAPQILELIEGMERNLVAVDSR